MEELKQMALVVQKYGGTSVADAERINAVARRVLERKKEGDQLVVVLSARAGETDRLIKLGSRSRAAPTLARWTFCLPPASRPR